MMKWLKKIFCNDRVEVATGDYAPIPEQVLVQDPNQTENDRLLAKFRSVHGDLNERFRFCPLTGKPLTWRIEIVEVAPFDMKTGRGVKSVKVEMLHYYSGYLHYYEQDVKKMKIWSSALYKYSFFD